ncbi:MAG: magnesium and cobalt exporter, family [Actinomycetota bacterium]|nr:magnesium and cobalt exporter, family [Actinomycetota bacterium]
MSSTELLAVVAIVVLVAFAALLAAAETALTNLPRAKALALEEEGRRGVSSLLRLLQHRERYLSPVLLLILMCHLTTAAIVGLLAQSYVGPVGIALSVVVVVAVIFVIAEAAPKTWALQHPERTALFVAPIVAVLAGFPPLRALTRFLIGLSNVLLPGKGRPDGPVVSEEELLAFAEVAMEEGEIESEERELIHSIIDFGDTVAREVMVPRPDMVTAEATSPVDEVIELVLQHGYSRIPVVGDGGVDDVVGIVYAKDLMRAAREARNAESCLTFVRPALFVPETKKVAELMREMQATKQHMAIVVDEYGGTAGLATLEDLIEELVGEIVDEYDLDVPPVEELPNGDVLLSGRLSLDEANDDLDLDLPTGDWDTVAGLLFNALGHVPEQGESVEIDGHVVRAEVVDGRRIERVRITRRPRDWESATT